MKKVAKSFERRKEATLQKVHLPTAEDLLYGMPFYGGELEADIREYAARTAPVARSLRLSELHIALLELSISASIEAVAELANAAAYENPTARVQLFLDSVMLRRRIYLAAWSQGEYLIQLAMETINAAFNQRSNHGGDDPEPYLHLTFRSIELLAAAAGLEDFRPYLPGRRLVQINDPNTNFLHTKGIRNKVKRRILDEDMKERSANSSKVLAEVPTQPDDAPTSDTVNTVVVIPRIGNPATTEGKAAASYARDLVGKAIPLRAVEGTESVRTQLLAEFPHANDAIDALLFALWDGRPIRIHPTIIVGGPGSGKSYFCRKFMEALGLPYTMIPFAGVADSSLIGTARRYSTAEPSIALSSVVAHKIANPGLILDEIEKAGTGSHNGNAIDSMLPMLEGVTAGAYYDPYLEAAVDVSHINWLMTANSLSPLRLPFRDRCRIIEFSKPSSEFLSTYVSNILPRLAQSRGQPAEMFRLAPAHVSSLANWTDGSMRTLTKMLEAILDEHEAYGRRTAH